MIESGWTIPGHSHVRFHIAVVGEQFALTIKSEVVRVSQSTSNNFNLRSFQVHPQDDPARSLNVVGVSARILIPWQQVAFIVFAIRTRFADIRHRPHMIADGNLQHSIGTKPDRVRSVFAGSAFEFYQSFDIFQLAITILIG